MSRVMLGVVTFIIYYCIHVKVKSVRKGETNNKVFGASFHSDVSNAFDHTTRDDNNIILTYRACTSNCHDNFLAAVMIEQL